MYVNYYDRYVKLPDENDTIGIIICKDKNDTLVKINTFRRIIIKYLLVDIQQSCLLWMNLRRL